MAQDYIMRLIEQIAAMLAAIIAKRRGGLVEEAKHDLATTCLQNVGMTLEAAKQLSPDALARHLESSGGNRYFRAMLLAELLIQDAEILESEGKSQQALPGYLHAFCLLADCQSVLSREDQATCRPKLEALATRLKRLPMNPYTSERIRAFRSSSSAPS